MISSPACALDEVSSEPMNTNEIIGRNWAFPSLAASGAGRS